MNEPERHRKSPRKENRASVAPTAAKQGKCGRVSEETLTHRFHTQPGRLLGLSSVVDSGWIVHARQFCPALQHKAVTALRYEIVHCSTPDSRFCGDRA